jgi:hypothetical protein
MSWLRGCGLTTLTALCIGHVVGVGLLVGLLVGRFRVRHNLRPVLVADVLRVTPPTG